MRSALSFIASLFSFRIAFRFGSLRIEVAKGHVIEGTGGSWTRFVDPINIVVKKDGIIAMGFSFRFGIQDWFDFGFRIGPRKPAAKPTGKEVLVHTAGSGYHVRYTGSMGRRVELIDDVMEPMLPRKSQTQCVLFKNIPPEIRRMILSQLLVSPERIASPGRLLPSKLPLLTNDYHPIPGVDARILRTCRAIYNEAMPILYGQNTFYFTNTHSLFDFLTDELPKALPMNESPFQASTGTSTTDPVTTIHVVPWADREVLSILRLNMLPHHQRLSRSWLTESLTHRFPAVFNFRVTPAGRLSLVRQLELRLTTLDSSRNIFNIQTVAVPRPNRPPHRSSLMYDWGRLLNPEGRMPGMLGDSVVFPALEILTLDFQDWALQPDEGLMTKPFIKKFSESGRLEKLTLKGITHQQTLDELRRGLLTPTGVMIVEP